MDEPSFVILPLLFTSALSLLVGIMREIEEKSPAGRQEKISTRYIRAHTLMPITGQTYNVATHCEYNVSSVRLMARLWAQTE